MRFLGGSWEHVSIRWGPSSRAALHCPVPALWHPWCCRLRVAGCPLSPHFAWLRLPPETHGSRPEGELFHGVGVLSGGDGQAGSGRLNRRVFHQEEGTRFWQPTRAGAEAQLAERHNDGDGGGGDEIQTHGPRGGARALPERDGADGAHEALGTRGSVSQALLLGDLGTLCRAGCRTTHCASQLTFWKAAHLPGWGQRPPQGRRDPRGQGWCPRVQGLGSAKGCFRQQVFLRRGEPGRPDRACGVPQGWSAASR